MTRLMQVRAIGAAVATLAIGPIGCGSDDPDPPLNANAAGCATTAGETSADTPTVAVLAQVGRTGERVAGSRGKALKLVVEEAKERKAHLLLNGVGAGLDAPNLVVNTTLVGDGENKLFRDNDLACKRTAIDTAYSGLGEARRPRKLDVFAALRTLKRDLEGVPHGAVDVVLLSSLLSTEGVDLTNDATLADPERAINALAKAGHNVSCDGWRVYAVGPSFAADGTLDSERDGRLKRFWKAYFRHCGGSLVSFNTELARFPIEGPGVEDADYRKIRTTIVRRPEAVVATLASEVLFDVGSSTLRRAAGRELRALPALIDRARGAIHVAGHTDDTGDDAINNPLSAARARAVVSWLAKRSGVSPSRFTVAGRGSRDPVAGNATPAGRAPTGAWS